MGKNATSWICNDHKVHIHFMQSWLQGRSQTITNKNFLVDFPHKVCGEIYSSTVSSIFYLSHFSSQSQIMWYDHVTRTILCPGTLVHRTWWSLDITLKSLPTNSRKTSPDLASGQVMRQVIWLVVWYGEMWLVSCWWVLAPLEGAAVTLVRRPRERTNVKVRQEADFRSCDS